MRDITTTSLLRRTGSKMQSFALLGFHFAHSLENKKIRIAYIPIWLYNFYMLEDIDHKTDEELVELTLKDQDNFAWLIRRYEDKLLRYILRIANISKEEAEDVLQEVFIKVYQNLNDFDRNLKFSSWIYRITHNQVISNWRKIKARPKSVYFEVGDAVFNGLISELDMEKKGDEYFLRKNLDKIFDKLDPKYREILILKFLEDKSYKEISDILKKPIGTVATLINRAKKSFVEEVRKQELEFS